MAPYQESELKSSKSLPLIPWSEVKKRDSGNDEKWIVIDNIVYNITDFAKKHPGGTKIISSHAGIDASHVWYAMHPDKQLVNKYMKVLQIGMIEDSKNIDIDNDFQKLRQHVESQGWLRANPLFYIVYTFQVHLFELLAALVLWYFGTGWLSLFASALLLCTAQAEAGWAQHDYGHLSVFNSRQANKIAHEFVIGHLKGASSRWWNYRHYLHHTKPNVIRHDPDVDLPYLFLLGEKLPQEWGRKRRGFMPYNWQQDYFFIFGPPILLPFYFHYENLYFIMKRKVGKDLIWTFSFFVKFFYIFNHFFPSYWQTFAFYMFVRFLESYWFTMVTQMSHIPMDIDRDQRRDWLSLQLKATCNAESSLFNDWFTGHLNYQIEHHLFPDMPRHNYGRVKPFVLDLCEKYGLKYVEKPLSTAFADIIRSLRKSGELWYEAYKYTG